MMEYESIRWDRVLAHKENWGRGECPSSGILCHCGSSVAVFLFCWLTVTGMLQCNRAVDVTDDTSFSKGNIHINFFLILAQLAQL